MRPELERAFSKAGVLRVSRGNLAKMASRAAASGELVRLLPGVYARDDTWRTRCAALASADAAAIVAGRAAAALTWWPDLEVDAVAAYREAPAQKGFRWLRGRIPPELTVMRKGLRLTSRAMTALDLIPEFGGRAIDQALRKGVAIAALNRALELTPGRPGNQHRRWLLDDSRDEPWSELERQLHRRLRALRLPWRYRTNLGVLLEDDEKAYLDCAIPELMLGVEADGYAYHSSRQAFERDRRRDPQLAHLGWLVVRLGEDAVTAEWFDRRILGIVASRARQLGVPYPKSTDSRQIERLRRAERMWQSRGNLA